jgi:predicted nucleic acid-binding protein
MPNYFFDTSALAKAYHTEIGSDFVLRIVHEASSRRWISLLSIVEIQSVFARKARAIGMKAANLTSAIRTLEADLGERMFLPFPLRARHYYQARDLVAKHGFSEGLRTLDAVQLTVALELQRSRAIDLFVAADQKLCRVAKLEGLAVINPEAPGPLLVTP